jgi:hypothetical protein
LGAANVRSRAQLRNDKLIANQCACGGQRQALTIGVLRELMPDVNLHACRDALEGMAVLCPLWVAMRRAGAAPPAELAVQRPDGVLLPSERLALEARRRPGFFAPLGAHGSVPPFLRSAEWVEAVPLAEAEAVAVVHRIWKAYQRRRRDARAALAAGAPPELAAAADPSFVDHLTAFVQETYAEPVRATYPAGGGGVRGCLRRRIASHRIRRRLFVRLLLRWKWRCSRRFAKGLCAKPAASAGPVRVLPVRAVAADGGRRRRRVRACALSALASPYRPRMR